MASSAKVLMLPFVLWLALSLIVDFGIAQTCMSSIEQPVVNSIDPPSGTTGDSEGLSSRYTITGERLDQVAEIIVELDPQRPRRINVIDILQDNSSISFNLEFTGISAGGIDASVMVVPNNTDCSTMTLTISLYDTARVGLNILDAQPGTTIATTFGTCLPDQCGDDSTMFDFIVGGVVLDFIETINSVVHVARFPEFTSSTDSADFVVSTQYQMFTLIGSSQFELFLPTSNAVVMPPQGQRGTRITITGTMLLGYGDSVSLSQVTIGGMVAEALSFSQDTIELRASSGPPGLASISINTTQSLGNGVYDGPYTYLEDVWTHLEDGFISDIIPPAVQVGGSVTLCGSRLLGGGASIAQVTLAGFSSSIFSMTPTPTMLPLPVDECITAEVPDLNGMSSVTGLVDVVADTGALVQSNVSFTYAEIQEVTPSRGQPGTTVTIRGVALLSGFSRSNVNASVTLNGVVADLVNVSETEIIVIALEPPTAMNNTVLQPPDSSNGTNATMLEPRNNSSNSSDSSVFGLPGAVVITVQGPDSLSSLSFTVASDNESWTYEPPGEIDSVMPAFGQFGTLLTITGTNLLSYGTSLTRATVGGIGAMVVEANETVVRLRAPDGAVGTAEIVLFADNGAEVRGVDLFEFRERGSISQVLPNMGQLGTFVIISGTNLFGHGDNITNVTFGDIPATIDFNQSNSTLIYVRIQSNTEITQDTLVSVTILSDTLAVVESVAPTWTYLVQGVVTAIQPSTGQEGTRVTLTGTNLLGGGGTAVRVLVDDVEGRIESVSDTSILVIMGTIDSQVGMAFPGQAFIMADTGAIVTGGSYTHQSSGSITSFSPQSGRGGTMVTITGQNLLGFGDSITTVTVAGNPAGTIVSFTDSQVVIQVGSGAENDEGPIQLTVNTGAVITSVATFTYVPPGNITDIIPAEGAEGVGVLIRGSALFPGNAMLTGVTVGGNPVSRIVTATASEISILVGPAPTSNPMMAEIIITASDGSFVNGSFFRFINLEISLPGRTSGREGTLIDITLPSSPEFNAGGSLRATVDDEEAEIVNRVAGTITVRVPRAKHVGTFTADVAIENQQRLVARLPNGFTYLPEGVIYVVTPNLGQRGTRVALEGENLLGGGAEISGAEISSAMVSGIPARVLSSGDQRVEIVIFENPAASTMYPLIGNILLTADTGAVTLRLNGFTIVQPGVIQTISPMSGQTGTRVTINGTDLLQGEEEIQQVTLAGVQATVTGNANDTLIIVEASSSSPLSGPVEILLTTGAQITSEQTFEYLVEGVIMTITPNHGTEGTRVTIEGSNLLGGGSRVERVLLNGVEARIESFTNDNVSVIVQAGEPEFGSVEIISDTGATTVQSFFWTYVELGSITSIEPPIGQRGIVVTLEGMRLLGSSGTSVTECRLAGISSTVVSMSRTSVRCRAGFFPDLISRPANGSGPAEVVTNTGVVIRSETNITFTYYIAQIDTVTPSTGNNGTTVQISGINIVGFPGEGSSVDSVEFGGVAATLVANTSNDITVRAGLSMNAIQNVTVRVTSTDGSFLERSDAWSFSALKQITSISPATAFPGDTINITGVSLNSPPVADVVVIVGQTRSAEARVVNDTTIEFVAGVHQSTDTAGEPLPVQIVYSTGETVFEPNVTFTYNETRGIIDSVTPNAGAENTMVTITGRNLLGNETVTQVYLAGVAVASIQENATNEEIVVIAGEGPNEGAFGTVVIETSDGLQFGLSGNAWRYYPRIGSLLVSPTSGQNGTVVTIDLSSVDPLPVIEDITLAGFSALEISVSPGRMVTATVETTANVTFSVAGDIVILFANSTRLSITDAWTYLESVQVTSFTPNNMQGYFNSLITLNGQNFQAGSASTVTNVYLAGLETQIISQSDTELQVRITESRNSTSQPIQGPVVIVSSVGAIYTSSDNFTYIQVRVDSVEPQQGQRGTRVNITGVGLLLGGSSISSIMLGDEPAAVNSATDTEIIAAAGDFPNQTNVSDIVYRADTEAELTIPSSWRYVLPGEITSVSPEEGGRGTIVTIMGTNLFGGGSTAETVLLNNVPAQSIVTNFNSLIQVVAGQSAMALSPGNVQVISDTGAVTESTMNVAYTYLTPGSITMATPQEGQNGTRITIDGSFLHNGEGVSRILLAGVEATIETTMENSLQAGFPSTFVVRAGRPSAPHSFSGPVTIISHFNTMSVSSFNFTYLSEGVIFSVTPDRGQGGTMVMIEGENLLGGGASIQRAYLAGTQADIFGTPTNNRVQLRANPSQEALLGDIVLVSDSEAFVRRVDGWSYVERGTVLDVQPPEGQWGTRIVITGEQLLSGGDRVVNGSLGTVDLEITSNSATRVTARVQQPPSPDSFNASNITLVSNFGGILTQNVSWLFLNQSMIETVSPPSGFGNTEVTINGTNLLGGGTTITSAVMDMTPAQVVSANDTQVVVIAGFNSNGQERVGDIVLMSDTGAVTVEVNGWTYDTECPEGQYGNVDNCLPCDGECLTCDGPNSTDCFTCRNFRIELANATTYVQCVPACASVSTLDRVCLDTCDPNTFPAISTTENITVCQLCHPQCDPNRRCTGADATQCDGCRNVLDVLNGTCIDQCPLGTYQDELNRCVPCDNQCTVDGGCNGPSSADCVACANVFVNTLIDGVSRDSCLQNCSSLYYQRSGSDVCAPCDSECLEGCTGPSPYECTSCKGPSFVFSNGTTLCVSTCNEDSSRLRFYEDSMGECRPCSSRCSYTGGCFGPTAFDCNGCRVLPGSNMSLPMLGNECVNACPNENSSYSFYADDSTDSCEPCDRTCSDGCNGPLASDCNIIDNPLIAGGGAIAIFVVILIIFLVVVVVLVVLIIYQRKHSVYKVARNEEDGQELVLKYRESETNLTSNRAATNATSEGITNAAFDAGNEEGEKPTTVAVTAVATKQESAGSIMKSEGETGSQELYTEMSSSTIEPDPRYSVPTPKSMRKAEEPPPVPAPYKKQEESKPPPPRPPSPSADGDLYTDMEANVQEVHVNPSTGVEPEEEYSEMAPAPIVHQLDEVYDDAESVQPTPSSGKPPTPTPKSEETAPLLNQDDMYEDADTAIALATEYKRISRTEPFSDPQKRLSGVSEKVPDLPSRPVPKKRQAAPLPETPLQKSLSGNSLSPVHQTVSSPPAGDDIYEETFGEPFEESLYEELPGGLGEAPQTNQPPRVSQPQVNQPQRNTLPLPPKPKK